LDRRVYENGEVTSTALNIDVEYPRYLILHGDGEGVARYQLIGTVIYENNKFISYFLDPDKK